MSTTAPAPHALTTPFVPPQSCADQFITTSFVSSYYQNSYAPTTVTVLASAPADPRFSSCQPSGWDEGTSSFHFSPAVCPSGWTAYFLRLTSLSDVTTSTASITDRKLFSTAICCSSGFTYSFISDLPISGIVRTAACYGTIATATPAPSFSGIDVPADSRQGPYPYGLRVHNAWQISWEASDVSTLSPTPPQILCTQFEIGTWVPGETIAPSVLSTACAPVPSSTNEVEHWSTGETNSFWFVIVGLPVLGFLLVVACLGCWCCKRNRKKKAKAAARAITQTPAEKTITQMPPGELQNATGLVPVEGK